MLDTLFYWGTEYGKSPAAYLPLTTRLSVSHEVGVLAAIVSRKWDAVVVIKPIKFRTVQGFLKWP